MSEKKKEQNAQPKRIKQTSKQALALKQKVFSGENVQKGISNDIRITKPKKQG